MAAFRQRFLAQMLGLSAPECDVVVERAIPVAARDGVALLTDHYAPRADGDFPTILIRTPYGRGREVALLGGYALAELPGQRIAERGYHVVVQGARGCFDSGGEFIPHVNEAADGQAAVVWIARQPWFNGVLGTWGPSYLGYMQWAAADAEVAPQAMLLMITSAENYGVTHPDGAFGLETRLRWCQGQYVQKRMHGRHLLVHLWHRLLGGDERRLQAAFDHLPLCEADVVAAGAPIPFYREMLAHADPGDEYWTARDHRQAVARVGAAVHLMGGWYDYYLRGLLRDYQVLCSAGRQPYLTIGPWWHANGDAMLTGLRAGIDWFDAHLKGKPVVRDNPVRIYVMGADEWRDYDTFPPPAREVRYYLRQEGRLDVAPPGAGERPDHYRYDPADPTPAVGGALLAMRGAGPVDNQALEARDDVLCYTTPPLAEDLEIIGPVRLDLHAVSSLTPADFFGRLCDVAPGGRSTNVCDGLVRVALEGGEAGWGDGRRIEVDLWWTAHRFRAGHRVRLQVSSGAHPRWSRNPGTGAPLGEAVEMRAANQVVFHDVARPSAVVLPVVSTTLSAFC
ncbi:MAG: CocE/NonD family hydrolase [Anaerolineae bacterium]|nr:CocE/NonD family hydrolase [Anaerolineae bacterium]